jgi:hypothetical protein
MKIDYKFQRQILEITECTLMAITLKERGKQRNTVIRTLVPRAILNGKS